MNLPLEKQTVLVTGAGRGLGSEIARSFHREGAKVIINYRNSYESAKNLYDSLGENAILVKGDIREKDQVSKMHEELASQNIRVDTIIHNAINDFIFNGDQRKKIDTIEWQDFQNQIETSQKGFLNLLNIFTPNMKNNSFGRVISIGTNLFQNPVIPYHDYTAAKGGVVTLTRALALQCAHQGIRVNAIAPGAVLTERVKKLMEQDNDSGPTQDMIEKHLLGLGHPQQLATVALFFASEDSNWITGQVLPVDGGASVH